MKLPTLNHRFWVALTTLLVIGAFFSYYLLVYVAGREDKLREEKYRALARYGQNMLNTRRDYENAIRKTWFSREKILKEFARNEKDKAKREASLKELQQIVTRDKQTELARIQALVHDNTCDSCNDTYQISKKLDELQNDILKTLQTDTSKEADFWKRYGARVRKKIKAIVQNDLPKVRYNNFMDKKSLQDLVHTHFDSIYFSFPSFRRPDRVGVFSIATTDFAYKPNAFDEFVIIKRYDESTHGHDKDPLMSADETYQTFENRIDLQNIDSLLVTQRGLLTTRFCEITLADATYKMFVHTIQFAPDESWMLCGLTKAENYNDVVRAVDPLVITVAILVVLFLLMSMPVLKLLFMNTFERLSLMNVWFAGFCIVFGSAVMFLILWSTTDNLQSKGRVDLELRSLSDQVKTRFQRELNAIYDQLQDVQVNQSPLLIKHREELDTADKKANPNPRDREMQTVLYGNFLKPWSSAEAADTVGPEGELKPRDGKVWDIFKVKPLRFFPYFNFIIWVNDAGNPIISVTTKSVKPDYPMPNVKNRKYYRWAMGDSLWYLPPKDGARGIDPTRRFALQSIQSWTDHTPEAGFGIRLGDGHAEKVLAMSTRLHSIMDPMLPPGYGFCLIDETGEVWFHSTTFKNHQENILLEADRQKKLTAAIAGRSSAFLSTEYDGCPGRMYVQPIDNIPLHLVVFHNEDFQRTPIVLTIFFAFFFLMLLFIIQGVQLFMLLLCASSTTKLKFKPFVLRWLFPAENKDDVYCRGIVTQAVIFVASMVLICVTPNVVMGIWFVVLPVMLLVFHTFVMSEITQGKKIIFALLSAALIMLFDYITFPVWDNAPMGFLLQIATAAFLVVMAMQIRSEVLQDIVDWYKAKTRWIRKAARGPNSKDIDGTYYYPRVLMFWLTLVSILPVTYFYRLSYREEGIVWTRYMQLLEAEREDVRLKQFDYVQKEFSAPGVPVALRDHIDQAGVYQSPSRLPFNGAERGAEWRDAPIQRLLFEFWPRITGALGASSAGAFKEADDRKWRWNSSPSGETIELVYNHDPRRGLHQESSKVNLIPTFRPAGVFYGIGVTLFIVLFLLLIINVIRICVKYIFGTGLLPGDMASDKKKFNELLERIKQPVDGADRVFVVGLPGSEVNKAIRGAFAIRNDIDLVNCRAGTFAHFLPHRIIIVQHFEYGLNDHAFNQKKLGFLQALITKKTDIKIIITSSVPPGALFEFYHKKIARCQSGEENGAATDKDKGSSDLIAEYKIALRNWKSVLGHFEVAFKSICPTPDEVREISLRKGAGVKSQKACNELLSCFYLSQFSNADFKPALPEEDDFILNVEETVEPYYEAVWNALSQAEKFLLFDLAKDGVVNLKDQKTLRMLMQKGIVRNDGTLRVFNESFNNFVLNAFDAEDEEHIEKVVQNKGTWHSIRLVLVLGLMGIVVFIAVAQKQLFNNLNTFLIALGSALGLLSKFGGLFGSGAKIKE
ncbi:hypothetical protein [Chryseolinea lacunae]|uniref:EF-hand domain-containing protein n=1 Tax=Chryseolinea lacunae TaxID=2801331 RepID=A0ABS1KK36_9BACT|nr:hypothetical protein [Chryseolinea lacunae]MBL0739718.1 hypothetical protein [Chryseolinea lacunae]